MFIWTVNMINSLKNTYPKTSSLNQFAASANGFHPQEQLWSELSKDAALDKWILFTAQCNRPTAHNLQRFSIPVTKVVHMKQSQLKTEIEVVMDAILSGNASAIVASDKIDFVTQNQLHELASEEGCKVYFTSSASSHRIH
jgi:cell division inhibitor SulA